MSNRTIDRLAVDKKQARFFAVPPVPVLPDTFARKTPELYRWSQDFVQWRERFSAYLKQQLQALAQPDDSVGGGIDIDAVVRAINMRLANYVLKSGDTMTGPLTLSGDPSGALQSAPKRYVDRKVNRDGDTMDGPLMASRHPLFIMEVATKGYVDLFATTVAMQHVHEQSAPASTWTIDHNRGRYPGGIAVMTEAANYEIKAARTDATINQTVLAFGASFDGRAVLTF